MNTSHKLPEITQKSAAWLANDWEQNGTPITMFWLRGEKMAWKRITRMTVGELEQAAEYHLRCAKNDLRQYHEGVPFIHERKRLGLEPLVIPVDRFADSAGRYIHFARFFAARSLQLQGVTPEEWMLPFSNMEDDA